MVTLVMFVMLLMIVIGTLANGTFISLCMALGLGALMRLVWHSGSNWALRKDALFAEAQLKADMAVLKAYAAKDSVSARSQAALVREFGHLPDEREVSLAMQEREHNLGVLRDMTAHQIRAGACSALLIGVATVLNPWIGIGMAVVYCAIRKMFMRHEGA